ncbi:MAG: hybrid sensor histidine kinase/response regulator, partial [Steroidobacteraceae bacterium]
DFIGSVARDDGSRVAALAGEVPALIGRLESLRSGELPEPVVPVAPVPTPPEPVQPAAEPVTPIDASLLELFAEEAETQLSALSEGLVALESAADGKAVLDALMRAAHSLKGAARIVGLDPLVKVSHVLEDYFVAALKGEVTVGPAAVDVLLGAVDFIGSVARDDGSRVAALAGEVPALVRRMQDLRAGVSPAAVQSPAPAAPTRETPPPAAAVPSPEPPPPPPAAAVRKGADKGIRMSTEALARLTAMAAETAVEAGRLERLVDEAGLLRERHRELREALGRLRASLEGESGIALAGSALAAAIDRLEECRRLAAQRDEQLEQFARRSTLLANRLSRETLASRMLPFGTILRGFPRLVRDLSRELGKSCRLTLAGEETAIDREILERLEAPLNHILRNALDHGLELPEDRRRAGKPPEGSLRVAASHRAGRLLVTVAEDGRGIDPERLRKAVIDRGLESPEKAERLSAEELYEFLFLPGFSTAAKVSEISGRGVGLDAVRSMVQEAGGAVTLQSAPGKGTTFNLELPITRAVSRALLVDIAGDRFAVPLERVDRALRPAQEDIRTIEGRPYLHVDGADVALVPAEEVLELEGNGSQMPTCSVLVVAEGARKYGLIVDRFVGESSLVVRPLDTRLGELPDVAAYSTDDAGQIILFLDVDQLVRGIDALVSEGRLRRPGRQRDRHGEGPERRRILVVDDSLTVRQAERQLLENAGYLVEVAVDGVEAWSAVRLGAYDLVVTDVDMPRMNGIELVRRIRGDARLERLPVVVVSYKDREEDRLRGLEVGADRYLAKGGLLDQALVEAVLDLIGGPER